MLNPTIHILINRARTEDLHRAAHKVRQRRIAAVAGRQARRRKTPRSASIRRAIRHLDARTTGEAAAAPSQRQ